MDKREGKDMTYGRPRKPDGDLGAFSVSGAPDRTNIKGAVAFEGSSEQDKALAALSGGVKRAQRNDSITAHGSASLPK